MYGHPGAGRNTDAAVTLRAVAVAVVRLHLTQRCSVRPPRCRAPHRQQPTVTNSERCVTVSWRGSALTVWAVAVGCTSAPHPLTSDLLASLVVIVDRSDGVILILIVNGERRLRLPCLTLSTLASRTRDSPLIFGSRQRTIRLFTIQDSHACSTVRVPWPVPWPVPGPVLSYSHATECLPWILALIEKPGSRYCRNS